MLPRNYFYISIFSLILLILTSCGKTPSRALDSGFVHTVYFWLQDPDNPEDRQAFEASLLKFMEASGHVQSYMLGTPPTATREVVRDDFTYSLTVLFADAAAQQAYQDEEAHLLFIDESESLWKKVEVNDAVSLSIQPND
ncbi:Dabb family protein [Croceiramulus getboli]|nr:Dabb family protein [Flavobacteriaceae bacterium YJPT1-3]